jgi:hypothetical protein
LDSQKIDVTGDHGLANERWLTVYKYYLMAAVALSVIGIAKYLVINFDQASGRQLVVASVWGVAQTGLFVFALWSMSRVGERWVRTLQLSINGIAAIMLIIRLLDPYGMAVANSLYYLFIRVGNVFVFPLESLVFWAFLNWSHGLARVTFIAQLIVAAYFLFRWLKLAPPHAAEQQTDPWRKHRIWAGLLTVLLGLFLGLFWLAFAQQMSFLSGVMSGVTPSVISIPFPVVAIVLGIIIGGLMFCGKKGRGRPMVWLAAVTAPLLTISGSARPVFTLYVLAISIYLIWVLRMTVPAKEGE